MREVEVVVIEGRPHILHSEAVFTELEMMRATNFKVDESKVPEDAVLVKFSDTYRRCVRFQVYVPLTS